MTPEQTAEAISNAAKASGDPVFSGLAWVLGVLLMVLALAKPFMGMVRQYQQNRASGAKDSADETLYNQLKDEIKRNSADIRALIEEKNHWHEEYINLKSRVSQLEECERAVGRMKLKLDQKDEALRDRDEENRRLMHEIIDLKDRLHALELRLAKDEAEFCANCEFKK